MTDGLARAIDEGRDELTPDEANEYLEDQVRKYLGITLDKFMELAERDELPEHPAVPHLLLLTGARAHSC